MKKIVQILFLLLCALSAASAFAADTFTATVASGTEVVMLDANAVIPVTITNNSATKEVREITFTVDTAKYNISSSTMPPAGWCVKTINTQTVTFSLLQIGGSCSNGANGSQILPGGSLTFNLAAVPASSSADVTTDSLTGISVGSQGGFTLSGSLPAWTRRSFEVTLAATPSSTATGGTILLTMEITNRSTAGQSGINSTPAPPSPSTPIVTYTEGPYYGSTSLSGNHNSNTTTISVGSTAEFPSSGSARIDSEIVCYAGKTAAALTGVTRGCSSTVAASHSSGAMVFNLTPFSIASGETRTILWRYSADSSGTVYFTARATNTGGTANSLSVSSNRVYIGNFTSSLSVSPASVISGQSITAQMNVVNNGSSALVNVTPSVLSVCSGAATETIVSGPSPVNISSLAPGASGVFFWTYSVTGSIGQTYCLSGNATANGPVSTPSVTSNTGTVSSYSVTVAPSTASSGSTNKTFTWTAYNGSGCTVQELDIATPASGGNWACSSVASPAGWSASCGNTVVFQSANSGNDIPASGTKSFSITFTTTETVASDKVASFPVTFLARGCGGLTSTLGTYITVTAYSLTLTHSPAGPIYADGSSSYTIAAALTNGGTPVSGKTVTFLTTNGTLSSSSAVTDGSGIATVALTAPSSTTNTSATITANYLDSTVTDTVNFNGWNKANIQYWGGLSPISVSCGSPYSFTMNLMNTSLTSMALGANSYFAFNDYSNGGTTTYLAYINAPVTIPPGTAQAVTFGSATSAGGGGGVTVPSTMLAGTFMPSSNSSPPPSSGLFLTDGGTNDQYRGVTDNITAGGNCNTVNVNIINWHEM